MKKPFKLFKRKPQNIWYYQIETETCYHSTGCKSEAAAERFVLKIVSHGKEPIHTKLRDFAKQFFIWPTCKWIQRQHKKKKRFSEAVAKSRRGHLINYILPEFGHKLLTDIKEDKTEDWLLLLNLSDQTRRHILYTFKIIMAEAKRNS